MHIFLKKVILCKSLVNFILQSVRLLQCHYSNQIAPAEILFYAVEDA